MTGIKSISIPEGVVRSISIGGELRWQSGPAINPDLQINSAALRADKVVSGKVATITAKAGITAETIVITDANGAAVVTTRMVRKEDDGMAVFSVIWQVFGSRGDVLDFTIRVFDADGRASVNTKTVTVTII